MAIRTIVPIRVPTVAVTQPIGPTTGVPGVAATDEALFMSVATLSANMSCGATVMGAIVVPAATIHMEAATAATAIIHTEVTKAIEGPGAMAMVASGVAGQPSSAGTELIEGMEGMPKDMRDRNSR
jgi:hypothetical protein